MKKLNSGIILLFIITLLLPLFLTFWGSFIDATGTLKLPPNINANYTLKNYITVLKEVNPAWLFNTVWLTVLGVTLSLFTSVMAGFGLYLKESKVIIGFLIASTVIPRYAIVIPQFLLIRYMGLGNTLIACALPLAATPLHILLAKAYFDRFPKSLIDAARCDGLSRFGSLFRIVLPSSKHLLIALGMLKAVELWGDYLWQFIVLNKPSKKTLYLGLLSYIQSADGLASPEFRLNPIGQSLTVSVLLMIPFILVFAAGSRYFMYQLGGEE